jgi:hypothetical protein
MLFFTPPAFVIANIINIVLIFTAAIYVIIPINNAFDKAPARLRLVYDSVIVVLFGLITYKFILKK